MEDWKNVIFFLLSPAYLLPAIIGYVFFTITRNAKMIDPQVIKAYGRCGKHWYEFEIKLNLFWGEKPEHFIFLIPAVNAYCLIGLLWSFWRCKRVTDIYLKLHQSASLPIP